MWNLWTRPNVIKQDLTGTSGYEEQVRMLLPFTCIVCTKLIIFFEWVLVVPVSEVYIASALNCFFFRLTKKLYWICRTGCTVEGYESQRQVSTFILITAISYSYSVYSLKNETFKKIDSTACRYFVNGFPSK